MQFLPGIELRTGNICIMLWKLHSWMIEIKMGTLDEQQISF